MRSHLGFKCLKCSYPSDLSGRHVAANVRQHMGMGSVTLGILTSLLHQKGFVHMTLQ
jgi:hypothetical protein